MVFIERIPDNLSSYYAGGYQPIPSSAEDIRPMSQAESYRLESVLQYKRTGKLLEIGPWIGLFSYAAKSAGFDVTVVELNSACIDFLRDKLHIRAIQSFDPAETLRTTTDEFDVIVLWHSIEHLPRPWDVIREASRRLAPGGILLVAAPNPESAQFRALGKHWYHLDAPRHLYLLPSSQVVAIAETCGLKHLSMTTNDKLGRLLTHIGWKDIVGRFVPIPGLRRAAKMSISPLLAAIFRDAREGAGAGYTTIMQKPA